MGSVVGQLRTELVKSGITLAIQIIGRSIVLVIIITSIVEGVGCKRDCVMRMDQGSTVVIDSVVVKTQSVGFLLDVLSHPEDKSQQLCTPGEIKFYMPFYQMLQLFAPDFGLSQKMTSKSYLRSAGTAVYAPSEAHMQNKMTFASDIWVLTVIVVEMLTGIHPYAGKLMNDTIENIKKGKMVFPLPDYIQEELKDMLMNMLNMDADKHPTAKELLYSELMQFQAQIDKANEKKDNK
ncbi:MAG: hypothetical protein EZS28_030068 [Streblomastix strix]|uniref:Protein kinase domain-containing protein n=1 Tax=Streblomastix strix TaxID=222440 RepID=A0A5J4UUU2_9EUKA|nr:MAG: hypothetical protein EZS28_030068 [Streblomastix strix]